MSNNEQSVSIFFSHFQSRKNVLHINRSLKSNWCNWICWLLQQTVSYETKYASIIIPLNGILYNVLLLFISTSRIFSESAGEQKAESCILHSANNLLCVMPTKCATIANYTNSDCLTGMINGMCLLWGIYVGILPHFIMPNLSRIK